MRITVNRRILIAGSMLSLMPRIGHSFENCGPIKVYEQQIARDALENSFWFPLGEQNHERTVYVLMAPWCPFCRMMKDDAIEGRLKFNIRVMPTEPTSYAERQKIAAAVLRQSDDTALAFFDRRPGEEDYGIDRGEMTFVVNQQKVLMDNIIRFQNQFAGGIPTGFPSTFGDFSEEAGGFQSIAGYNEEIREFLNSNLIYAPVKSSSDAFGTYQSVIKKSDENLFAEARNEISYLRSLPLTNSFPVNCVAAATGFRMNGMVTHSNRRFAYSEFSPGMYSFASEEEFYIYPR